MFCLDTNTHMCAPESNWTLMFMFCFDTNTHVCSWVKLNAYVYVLPWHKHTYVCSWVKLNAYVYVLLWHKHISVLLSQIEHLCLCSALTQTHMCAPESNWTLMFMFCFDTNTSSAVSSVNCIMQFTCATGHNRLPTLLATERMLYEWQKDKKLAWQMF